MPEIVQDALQQNQDPDRYLPVSKSDQDKSSLSIMQEKVLEKLPLRRNPEVAQVFEDFVEVYNVHGYPDN